jgi:hypothetical protein
MSFNATILRTASCHCGAFLVARFLECDVAHILIALYHALWHTDQRLFVLTNVYSLQPRHRHQKDPCVYCGSHPCLDRNLQHYRIAITAHLAVIPSFLPFCQQYSPWASVMPDVFTLISPAWSWNKVPEIDPSFSSTYSFRWIRTWDGIYIRVLSYQSSWLETACHSFDMIFPCT